MSGWGIRIMNLIEKKMRQASPSYIGVLVLNDIKQMGPRKIACSKFFGIFKEMLQDSNLILVRRTNSNYQKNDGVTGE